MNVKSRKICEIELKPDELEALAKARDVLEQILNAARAEGVVEFKMVYEYEYENYNLNELVAYLTMFNDLCHPCIKLIGCCNEHDSK